MADGSTIQAADISLRYSEIGEFGSANLGVIGSSSIEANAVLETTASDDKHLPGYHVDAELMVEALASLPESEMPEAVADQIIQGQDHGWQ